MSEPRTDAGKRLLAELMRGEPTSGRTLILAIEAEAARAPDGLAVTEAQARAFHNMTQVGGPWSPCSGPFGVPMECLCYEMASDARAALDAPVLASPLPAESPKEPTP